MSNIILPAAIPLAAEKISVSPDPASHSSLTSLMCLLTCRQDWTRSNVNYILWSFNTSKVHTHTHTHSPGSCVEIIWSKPAVKLIKSELHQRRIFQGIQKFAQDSFLCRRHIIALPFISLGQCITINCYLKLRFEKLKTTVIPKCT